MAYEYRNYLCLPVPYRTAPYHTIPYRNYLYACLYPVFVCLVCFGSDRLPVPEHLLSDRAVGFVCAAAMPDCNA